MRKVIGIVGVFALAGIFLSPPCAATTLKPRLGFRLTGGLGYIGAGDFNQMILDWNDTMTKVAPLYTSTVDTTYETVHTGLDIGLEADVWLSDRYGLALGVGYLDVGKSNNNIQLTSPGWRDLRTRDTAFRSIPLSLGGFYSLPIGNRLTMRGEAGLDFHFVRWKDRLIWTYNGDTYQKVLDDLNLTSGGLGGHLSISAEYELSKRLALVVELRGRYARIGGLKGDWTNTVNDSPWQPREATLYTYEMQSVTLGTWYSFTWPAIVPPKEGDGLRNIREAVLDMSGFALRAGIRVRL